MITYNKKMKKAYYFFFYTFYRVTEKATSGWLSEWKATFFVATLQLYLLMAFLVYLAAILKKDILPDNKWVYTLPVTLVVYGSNYYIFLHKEKWRNIISLFKNWPKRKVYLLNAVCWLITIIILLSLVFAFYKMSLVDWNHG